MTTPSQKAFETHTRFYHQLPKDYEFPKEADGTYAHSYQFRDFEKWQAAEAYGRKQALEDVANSFQDIVHAVSQHATEKGLL